MKTILQKLEVFPNTKDMIITILFKAFVCLSLTNEHLQRSFIKCFNIIHIIARSTLPMSQQSRNSFAHFVMADWIISVTLEGFYHIRCSSCRNDNIMYSEEHVIFYRKSISYVLKRLSVQILYTNSVNANLQNVKIMSIKYDY